MKTSKGTTIAVNAFVMICRFYSHRETDTTAEGLEKKLRVDDGKSQRGLTLNKR